MALSGSLSTTKYTVTGQGDRYLTLDWTATQNVADNSTTIKYTVKGAGTYTGYIMTGPIKITIDIYDSEYTERIQLTNGLEVVSGSVKINHNTDGTKKFTISLKGAVYSSSYNVSGSKEFTLDTIPREATITSADNFTDEGTPKVSYSNPADASAKVEVGVFWDASTSLIPFTVVTGKTGTKTFTLTTAQKNAIYNKLASKKSETIYYYIRTTIGNTVKTSRVAKTVSIDNGTPTISASIIDLNSWSIALTGDKTKLVKDISNAQITVTYSLKKGANLKSLTIKNGTETATSTPATFTAVKSNKFIVILVDSRGNSVTQDFEAPFVDAVATTCAMTVSNPTADGTLDFVITGDYFNGSFGFEDNYLEVRFRYREKGVTSWGSSTKTSITITGNTYRATGTQTGLDYTKTYEVQAYALSVYDTAYSDIIPIKTKPVFDWSGEDFNFNVPVTFAGRNTFNDETTFNKFVTIGYNSRHNGWVDFNGSLYLYNNNMYYNDTKMDFVIEEGTSNGWYYRKWKSGKAECWKTVEVQTTITTAWGSMYGGTTKMSRQNYPFTFAKKPVEIATLQANSSATWLIAESSNNGVNGAYASAIYNVCRPSQVTTSQYYYISLYVYGELA